MVCMQTGVGGWGGGELISNSMHAREKEMWWWLMVCGDDWWCAVMTDGVWWWLMVCDDDWWCVVMTDGVWWWLMVCDDDWWCAVMTDGVWWWLMVCMPEKRSLWRRLMVCMLFSGLTSLQQQYQQVRTKLTESFFFLVFYIHSQCPLTKSSI